MDPARPLISSKGGEVRRSPAIAWARSIKARKVRDMKYDARPVMTIAAMSPSDPVTSVKSRSAATTSSTSWSGADASRVPPRPSEVCTAICRSAPRSTSGLSKRTSLASTSPD
jgi:hypothetical protein